MCVNNCCEREKKNELGTVYKGCCANKFKCHMLGTGIVTFITAAAGRLDWKDLQWGNRIQAMFPGHRGVWLYCSPAVMTSSPTPHFWLIGLRFHIRAGTMDYWVWSSVSKRPGHVTVVLYWSILCSHHWIAQILWRINEARLQWLNKAFLFSSHEKRKIIWSFWGFFFFLFINMVFNFFLFSSCCDNVQFVWLS